MNKKQFLFLCCFFLHASISYSCTPTDLSDIIFSRVTPLESLLERIRISYQLSPQESPAIDTETSRRISKTVEETESLYKRAKYGDQRALIALKAKTTQSAHACVLMMKYYTKKGVTIKNSLAPEYESYLSIFFTLLGEKLGAIDEFEEIMDPLLNLSLAIYHQKKDASLAAQYAQAAVDQGCIEGYTFIGKLDKKVHLKRAMTHHFKAAQYKNPRGIYKLARSCYKLNGNFIEDLYKHAAARGVSKAYFDLGRKCERESQKEKSIWYFSQLIEVDPYLFVHKEQKKGLGRTAFYVANQLLKKNPSLLPPLLKAVYEHNPSKRKEVSHFLASSYSFGQNGFPQSTKDALYWLNISAEYHGDLNDVYRLCCLSVADLWPKESLKKLIAMSRGLVNSPEILERYGTIPQILLARLLVEEGDNQDNPRYFEEAMGLFLNALGKMEEDSPRRKRTVWRIPGTRMQGKFPAVESAYEKIVITSSALQKRLALYELGFHHLWGGSEGTISLTKALECFFKSANSGSSIPWFYVTIINHHLTSRWIRSSLIDRSEGALVPFRSSRLSQVEEALTTYLKVEQLLDRLSDLGSEEKERLKSEVRELSLTNFEGAALSLAAWFRHGMFGLSPSTEHEIYWLKLAAEKSCVTAQRILKDRSPLVLPLTDEEERTLHHLRTHTKGQPDFLVVGGGLSGVMTALSVAKAKAQGKIHAGKISIIEERDNILTGASMIVARQHRGGEYTQDRTTAAQCLYGSVLWEQMFKTSRMLTTEEINDFLLAKASRDGSTLSEKDLIAHHAFLNERYQQYLSQFEDPVNAQELLFGASPIFHELTEEELRNMSLDHHFAAGIRTTEHGFQPVGMGVVLEHLLRLHNVEVITGYEVGNIKPLLRGGFEINGRSQQPIYARYLINAAWHNNSHLAWLLKRSVPSPPLTVPNAKRVFLRCLALVDISQCSLPKENHSFFGLVGEHGGMVSCFNDWTAAIFVPGDGLSYQGDYDLDVDTVNELPYAAKNKLARLKAEKMMIAKGILDNAKEKYPFLEKAGVRELYVQTVVSENDEICKRTHSSAKWVEGVDGCLQICAMKATFAPFVGLEALARFVADKPDLHANFNGDEIRFLNRLIHPDMFKEGTVENAVLPDCFKLIQDDRFMSDSQFWTAMRRYAFKRGLDFSLFEKTADTAAAGMDPSRQFELVSQEEGLKEVDLEHHTLTAELANSLFTLLGRIERLRLGPLEEETNDDETDELGKNVLTELKKGASLKDLTIRGWNLTFASRHIPLETLVPNLQELHLKDVTLTLQSMRALFGSGASLGLLKRLSIVQSHSKKAALKELMKGIRRCENLTFLDLSGNEIRGVLSNETDSELQQLVSGSKKLQHLTLHNNNLFEGGGYVSHLNLPQALEASPFLIAITRHPHLKQVDIHGNGFASSLLQDRLDSYFAKRIRRTHQ